jgi:hypothetical protein
VKFCRIDQRSSARCTRRNLREYAKTSYGVCRVEEKYFVINIEQTAPALWLATGDPDIRSFDLGASFLSISLSILDVHYSRIDCVHIHKQFWRYRVEEKLHLGVWEQKGLNTTRVSNQLKTKDWKWFTP